MPTASAPPTCEGETGAPVTVVALPARGRPPQAAARRAGLDAWGRPEDDQAVEMVASWAYVGAGYATEGERWLALSAAARAREARRIAKEELRTTRIAA
jgi:hypothetical protein